MTRLLALLVLATLVACSSDPSSSPASAPAAPAPPVAQADLTASLDALKADFNAHRGEARFLTLLSPS